ncbi:MAG: Gfo/Idh/MocA family oxidoreductase [Kiritimatiellae bacterium]|nr:Gfo/Idh/MocA family oxidoreductase [Kiritimatiellia bacterium]
MAVRLGIIGLGPRAETLVAAMRDLPLIEVAAICDIVPERVEKMLSIFKRDGKPLPRTYADYHDLIADTSVEGVLVPTSWNSHLAIATEAMEAGKYAGIEVGGASSIDELWGLVHASERTGVSCMMLENCCYGRNELMVMNMVRKGLFGELVYAEGGYEHDLSEMALAVESGNERAIHNRFRRCDLYPTHQLGPIAKTFDINRGNRFLSLTSSATKQVGFEARAAAHYGHDGKWGDVRFAQGDVVTTVIKCARGENITLTHCVSLPRPYSRHARIQGSRGIWSEDCKGIYVEGVSRRETLLDIAGNPYEECHWDPVEKFYEEYDHPIWREYAKSGLVGGHGGMDGLVLSAFADAIRDGRPTPIDVYDVAAWMATTTLSEQSIALGSAPVAYPDFTNGKWMTRGRDATSGRFAL